jgi:hypothetical protein
MIGEALREIGQDKDVLNAVYETLEVERLLKGSADITLVPDQSNDWLVSLLSLRNEPAVRPPQPTS